MKTSKDFENEKILHSKTKTGLQLKTERLKIAENQNKLLKKELGEKDLNISPTKQRKSRRQGSYDQKTYVVTEEEIEKKGKEEIFRQMKKNNTVAFPDRSESGQGVYSA